MKQKSNDEEQFDWKQYRMTFDKKAEEIVNSLSLEEKVSLMGGCMTMEEVRAAILNKRKTHYNETPYRAGDLEDKGIPSMFFADGTRGVVCGRGEATCFPVSSLRGATFDVELEQRIGEAVSEEVLGFGGNLFGGVCVNLPYHPGWGRAQESYGEDSFLIGEMGAALVRGVQKNGVIACVKHFAFNSMENSRFDVNITCDKQTEQEVFLPHFKKCVEAGAGAVMSAYNSYQGDMCGHSKFLLTDTLKNEWGFDGFVLCDFNWGLKDTVAGANAGLDMEMPNTFYYGENLVRAVEKGDVSEKTISEAAIRIVRTLLAHQEVIEKRKAGWKKAEKHPLHTELALECARKGITLLKNEKQVLPISGKCARGQIVVLGQLADRDNTGDRGSSRVYPPYVETVLMGIRKTASQAEVVYYNGESLSHCRRLAKNADAVIIVAGNDYHDEGEYVKADDPGIFSGFMGGDRMQGLNLKEKDAAILDAVGEIRQDAIVVLMGGSVLLMDSWHEKAGAILMAYYPGMEGGTALGEIIMGKVNPGGKLPFSIPVSAADLPKVDWITNEQFYDYYHGYTLLEKNGKEALYPFGFGLSYTSFSIEHLKVWSEAEVLYASVLVTNTGKTGGEEVIQLYIGKEVRSLKAFKRLYLGRCEQQEVILQVPSDTWKSEPGNYEIYVGNSSRKKDLLKTTFCLE